MTFSFLVLPLLPCFEFRFSLSLALHFCFPCASCSNFSLTLFCLSRHFSATRHPSQSHFAKSGRPDVTEFLSFDFSPVLLNQSIDEISRRISEDGLFILKGVVTGRNFSCQHDHYRSAHLSHQRPVRIVHGNLQYHHQHHVPRDAVTHL